MARSAAERILTEVRRWAAAGLERVGEPFEAIAYPLSALIMRRPRSGAPTPLETTTLADVKVVVVADAILPPDEVKAFGSHNCHFEGEDLGAANAAFNDAIASRIADAPRLEVHTKLHSHPFQGAAWLSGMDVEVNVIAPGAVRWRQRLGLEFALLQIAYPLEPPARMMRGEEVRWRIASFACSPDGTVQALGDVKIVADTQRYVRFALARAYWQSDTGKAWDREQKQRLRDAGWGVSRGWLRRGWRRFLVELPGEDLICICVPPVPAEARIRVLRVVDAARNLFEPLSLPRGVAWARSLRGVDLVALAQRYQRGRRRRTAPATALPSPQPAQMS